MSSHQIPFRPTTAQAKAFQPLLWTVDCGKVAASCAVRLQVCCTRYGKPQGMVLGGYHRWYFSLATPTQLRSRFSFVLSKHGQTPTTYLTYLHSPNPVTNVTHIVDWADTVFIYWYSYSKTFSHIPRTDTTVLLHRKFYVYFWLEIALHFIVMLLFIFHFVKTRVVEIKTKTLHFDRSCNYSYSRLLDPQLCCSGSSIQFTDVCPFQSRNCPSVEWCKNLILPL